MKKPAASPIKKKIKNPGTPKMKISPPKNISFNRKTVNEEIKLLLHQLKEEMLEKMDMKINSLVHRFDRIEGGIEEILVELRESDSLMDSKSERYEGQA